MHLSDRLGLNHGHPITPDEGEILTAFEQLFIDHDLLFLRWGSTITLTSDAGTTLVCVRGVDRVGATISFVMVPSPDLPVALVKEAVAGASAVQESPRRLLIVERPRSPLLLIGEVRLARPYRRDEVQEAFLEFAEKTEGALAAARTVDGDDE